MFYAIISEDKPNTLDQRMAARPAHLERLIALKDEGRLLIAGPHPAIDSEDRALPVLPAVWLSQSLIPWNQRRNGLTMTLICTRGYTSG